MRIEERHGEDKEEEEFTEQKAKGILAMGAMESR